QASTVNSAGFVLRGLGALVEGSSGSRLRLSQWGSAAARQSSRTTYCELWDWSCMSEHHLGGPSGAGGAK
ncbi:hypothetical protein HaLaN_32698, partial [Haematococcus lacustris]